MSRTSRSRSGDGVKSVPRFRWIACSIFLVLATALAATIELAPATFVKDLNPRTPSETSPDVLCKHGNLVYFRANDGVHGFELWRTDGTTDGTILLKDAGAGLEHSGFDYACFGTTPNGITYLRVFNAIGNWELWRTDGTPAGTRRFVEPPLEEDPHSTYFVGFVGDSVLYVPNEEVAAQELWISDGTPQGTRLVRAFDVGLGGPAVTNLSYVSPAGPRVLFGAQDIVNGVSLWITDGTAAGTRQLANTPWGVNGYYDFAQVGPYVLFRSTNAQQPGDDLWRTDGTPAGTIQLTSPPAPGVSSVLEVSPVSLGNKAIFALRVNDTTVTLWSSDGTPQNTQPIHGPAGDLVPDTVWTWKVLNGRALLAGTTIAEGREPWTTDGTEAGTLLLADIAPGAADSDPFPLFGPQEGSFEVFQASADAQGAEPWVTDGTPAGTHLLVDLRPDAGPPPEVGFTSRGDTGFLLNRYAPEFGYVSNSYQLWRYDFAADRLTLLREFQTDGTAFTGAAILEIAGDRPVFFTNEVGQGLELWSSDGTVVGTRLLRDIVKPLANAGSDPNFLGVTGPYAWFSAANNDDFANAYSLWRTDGTALGTMEASDMHPRGEAVALSGDRLFFAGYYQAYGIEPWVAGVDGIANVKDIYPGTAFSMRSRCADTHLLAMHDVAYFPAFEPGSGEELWRSDGTDAGTIPVVDIVSGTGSSSPCSFAEFDGQLYFAATQGGDRELWRTDGTAAGTARVADIRAVGSSDPTELTVMGGVLYFVATGANGGRQLWRSDGTEAGTVLAVDVSADTTRSQSIRGLVTVGGHLFFTACSDGATPGCHLWSTDDGSIAGTVSLAESDAAIEFGRRALGEVAGKLLFVGSDGATGRELWSSDGTLAGTQLLADLQPGGDSNAIDFADFHGIVYFRAATGEGHTQVWRTDGTVEGTLRVSTLSTGDGPIDAAENSWRPIALGQQFLFAADDDATGMELWSHPNRQPIAAAESATTTSAVAVSIDVVANDTDADGSIDPGTVRIVTAPTSGTVSVNTATGVISYTSDDEFEGSDEFSYVVADNQGYESPAATVSVTVNAPPPPSGGGRDDSGGGGAFTLIEALLALAALLSRRFARP